MPLPDSHFRRLEALFHAGPINAGFYHPELAVSDGAATVTLTVRSDFFHAGQAVHGSVLFKLLDDAAWFAANSVVADVFVLTASYQLDLLRPVTGGLLVARGRVVHAGRQRILAEALVVDGEDRLVARGSGSFLRSNVPLEGLEGYRSVMKPA